MPSTGCVCLLMLFVFTILIKSHPAFGTSYFTLMTVLRAFNMWFWLLPIVGFGTRYFGFTNIFLAYANQAVLPFYIFHQTIIVTIGFYLIDGDIAILPKYAVLSTASFMVIMGLYEIFVRRTNILRYLFGLKIYENFAG